MLKDKPLIESYDEAIGMIADSYESEKGKVLITEPAMLMFADEDENPADMELAQDTLFILAEIQNRTNLSLSEVFTILFTSAEAKNPWMASILILWAAMLATARLSENDTQKAFAIVIAFLRLLATGKENGFSEDQKILLNGLISYITNEEPNGKYKAISFPEKEVGDDPKFKQLNT